MNIEVLTAHVTYLEGQKPLDVLHLCWPCQQDLRKTQAGVGREFLGKPIIEEAIEGVTRCLYCRWAEYQQGS